MVSLFERTPDSFAAKTNAPMLEDLDVPYPALEHLPIDAPIPEEAVDRIARRQVPISTTLMTYGKTGDAYSSQLFRNNGDGTFTDIAPAAGVNDGGSGTAHPADVARAFLETHGVEGEVVASVPGGLTAPPPARAPPAPPRRRGRR